MCFADTCCDLLVKLLSQHSTVDALNTSVCFEEVCARHMNICINVAVTKFQKSCQHTVLVQLRASDVNVGLRKFSPAFLLLSFGSVKV